MTRMSGEKKQVAFNRVLRRPDVKHGLVPVSSSCDDGHNVELTSRQCFVKVNCVAGVDSHAGCMYSVNLEREIMQW